LQGGAKPVTCTKLLKYLSTNRGAPCAFYPAILIERPTSTPSYDISLRRIRASHVKGHVISAHADC